MNHEIDDPKWLGECIFAFLQEYGKKMPNSDEYNSPDGEEMAAAACHLVNFGSVVRVPFSEFSQGGYRCLNDKQVREKHDFLVSQCRKFVEKEGA